jgi:hypothetical protein
MASNLPTLASVGVLFEAAIYTIDGSAALTYAPIRCRLRPYSMAAEEPSVTVFWVSAIVIAVLAIGAVFYFL